MHATHVKNYQPFSLALHRGRCNSCLSNAFDNRKHYVASSPVSARNKSAALSLFFLARLSTDIGKLVMFAKIFSQIYDSTLAEDWQVRLVFTDLLTLADINGVVEMTHEAISRRTNVPLEIVRRGISELEKPDPHSRTKADEGRRIQRLEADREWGWFITNYEHYRKIASEEQRRSTTAARVARFKDKQAKGNASVTHGNALVTVTNGGNAMQKQKQKQKQREMEKKKEVHTEGASADSNSFQGELPAIKSPAPKDEARPENVDACRGYAVELKMPAEQGNAFFDFFSSNGWKVGGKAPMKDWRCAMRNWKRNSANFGTNKRNQQTGPYGKYL